MIPKELTSVTIADIQTLIDNSVPEGKTIEYKLMLALSSESDRKEFLYDVSSFANASGGDIVVGVKEDRETGYPTEIIGIEGNMDQLQLQLDSMIRDGIAPRLAGVVSKVIAVDAQKNVMIIRIPKSWNHPHQVTFKGADKFYSRSNRGKYKLDVTELRNAFVASATLRQQIAGFVDERVSAVIANEGPIKLLERGKIILHVVPLEDSFDVVNQNLKSLVQSNSDLLRPLGNNSSHTPRYNFDGVLSYAMYQGSTPAYLQLFRNGRVEGVDAWIIFPFNGQKQFYVNNIEEFIINFARQIKSLYQHLQIANPALLFLTISGVEGYSLLRDGRFFFSSKEIDKNVMRLNELLVEDWEIDFEQFLKPWFDALWNAVGIDGSRSYQQGKWTKFS